MVMLREDKQVECKYLTIGWTREDGSMTCTTTYIFDDITTLKY